MAKRLATLRSALAEQDLDGVLVTNPANRMYLSGFLADDVPPRLYAALLIGPDHQVVLTGSANIPWAETSAPDFDVRAWPASWEAFAAELAGELGITRLGYEEHAISVGSFGALSAACQDRIELKPIGALIDDLRAIKSQREQSIIADAIAVTDHAFQAATVNVVPGMTEAELAHELDFELRRRGAHGQAFETIVASGPNAARPHHTPGGRSLQPGEPIIIDMGAKVRGYCGDLTRTIWLGDPDDKLVEIYGIVAEAQAAAVGAIRAGVPIRDIDAAARSVIQGAGYGDYFTHGLGHGVGYRIHEAPTLSQYSFGVLQAGQVTTIEPGIYIPDWGGVRIEDVGVVTEDGVHILTRAPKLQPARERSVAQ